MKIFDNISEIVRDDMADTIKKGSKVSVAAACFSMYAYKELKKQLEGVENFRFIFTSPTFTTEKASKEKREFYIPRLNRESSLYGTEFEIKLRNEMTQKSIAKECADWIQKESCFQIQYHRGKHAGLYDGGFFGRTGRLYANGWFYHGRYRL